VGDRVTLQTLADRLGVSRTTASNAFNRPDQLNPALREKVLALAAELGYGGPDPAGRALRSGRAGSIGVLLTEQLSYAFTDPAAVATLRGRALEAEELGVSLALLPAPVIDGVTDTAAITSALIDGCFVYALAADTPASPPRSTAVLGMSDELALGVVDGAAAAGVDLPRELSVVGFDDAPPAAPRGLTTVRQPLVEKGRTAGRMLLEAIGGGAPADVSLPTELVVRASTARP